MVLHHDIELLPSGNILALLWQRRTYDEAVQAGRNPESLESDLGMLEEKVIELKRVVNPDGTDSWEIVWQWSMWDHFIQTDYPDKDNYVEGDVSDYPHLIDINYNLDTDTSIDVFHVNAVFYLERYDQIVLTSHFNSELWVIDHSTTTAEAATSSGGKYQQGGDLLYRWGNAQAYGYSDERYTFLSGVHDPSFVYNSLSDNKVGTFFMYDNNRDSGENTQVIEMNPPLTSDGQYLIGVDVEGVYGPIKTMLQADLGFQQDRLGTVKRLSSGEIFTCNCAGTGEALWLDKQGKLMASMTLSSNTIGASNAPEVYRIQHYWSTDEAIKQIEK
ncbi:aryl-sulfate sulfotransferase [uncultured Shewanella sp.]|uniref:aryl-sulfate sulfotransferase n=1 Tax=uncultured Shewanella sp. TaxID=173975 RepID=UPI0026291790|nr:aryl-sulfate sulfotransferase [uncultured Shewanella sp.]